VHSHYWGACYPTLFRKKRGKGWGTEGLFSIGSKTRSLSVIVCAAEVVAAVGADEFAVVAGEAMTAGGTDLAVVVDASIGRLTTL
jgi:hypothetical protein